MNTVNLNITDKLADSNSHGIESIDGFNLQQLLNKATDIESRSGQPLEEQQALATVLQEIANHKEAINKLINQLQDLGINTDKLSSAAASILPESRADLDNASTDVTTVATYKELFEALENVLTGTTTGAAGSPLETAIQDYLTANKQTITQEIYKVTARGTSTISMGFLENSNNTLIELMITIMSIFSECLRSIGQRGDKLKDVDNAMKQTNAGSATFAQLSAAIALAPAGITDLETLFEKAGASGANANFFNSAQAVANAMGLEIIQGAAGADGKIQKIGNPTILTGSTFTAEVEKYFSNLQLSQTQFGGNSLSLPITSSTNTIPISKAGIDIITDELGQNALYAGNVSQEMMQQLKVLEDFLSIYMQAASSATSANKEANQAIYR